MATERLVTAAVDRAVETATVDPDAGVCFQPEALAAVVGLCRSGRGRDEVLAAVDRALRRGIDGLDTDRTLAAVTLVHRIEAATEKRHVAVENLQGDVGTGRGPATA